MHKRDSWKKLLLTVAVLIAVAAPILFGQENKTQSQPEPKTQNTTVAPKFEFEVASIKPHKSGSGMVGVRVPLTPARFTATNVTLQMLIREAYGVEDYQLSGVPKWLNSEGFDIEAKPDSSLAEELQKLSLDQRRPLIGRMFQSLLEDRCQLKFHRETKELPIYSLVIAKNGPKIHESKPDDNYANGFKLSNGHSLGAGLWQGGRGQLTSQGAPLSFFVRLLSPELGRTVVDKTGLKGNYDWTLQYSPESQTPMFGESNQRPSADASPPDSSGPSIFTAIQEQLGLKLESGKDLVEIIVIDHIERPSEN